MRKIASLLTVASGCLLLGGLAIAQQTPTSRQQPYPTVTVIVGPGPSATPAASPAGVFSGISQSVELPLALNFLHHTNQLEITEADSALPVVTDPTATTLAQTMITDATANENSVTALAASEGIALLPFQESTYELAADNALDLLASPTYDSSYVALQLQFQESALTELERLLTLVTDPNTRALINTTIPLVESHIRLAGGPSITTQSPTPSATPSPSVSASASPSPSPSSSP